MQSHSHPLFKIIPIPAFEDNYIWLLHNGTEAIVVDPGDATPVIDALQLLKLNLTTILITHHHHDHIGGVPELMASYPNAKAYAPKKEKYAFNHTPIEEGDVVCCDTFNVVAEASNTQTLTTSNPLQFSVIDLPGHTLGHIAYYTLGILFCGDTLFGAGCGRLFEGTPAQMATSLQKLAELPLNTKVYCTHEYTLHNLHFAMQYEPNNAALNTRLKDTLALRAASQPSLPSNIALELASNPFLRCNSPEIIKNLQLNNPDAITVFTALRTARNDY